ncbi:hypothetical protein E8E12_000302 [Didymella heteroderae]|uniref:Uncharacterized protein n=1 Tax=Didymella heteroderae TaxID=1769908 RepID=A0A9P4WFN3_9PLEO|nr:hypothetical protein E8E12_000302 [Didymella heteroderae]
MPKTIIEYLRKPNPKLQLVATTTQSTSQDFWNPIEAFEEDEDFTWENLMGPWKDVLEHKFDSASLPKPIELLPIGKVIQSEEELQQDPLKNLMIKVNRALQAAYSYLRGKKEAGFGHAPTTADTRYHKPVEQCLHYCILNDTRYGFIITDKELVVLRVRREEIGPGASNDRPRRVLPTVRYSAASSSMESSMQNMSLYSGSGDRGASFVAWRSIDWNETKDLTVGLALFLLAMMASTPAGPETIGDNYGSLQNVWQFDKTNSKTPWIHRVSGRTRKELRKGDIELVDWVEHEDEQRRTYFSSHLGTTYLQAAWSDEQERYYVYDHYNKKEHKGKNDGLIRSFNDLVEH